MPSLDGVYAKVERAKEHRDHLKRRLREVLEDPALSTVLIEAPYDPATDRFQLRVAHAPKIPGADRLSVIAGDAIHNLRSALDYLAYEVTALHPNGPFEKSQFPIVNSLSDLNRWRNRETLARFTPEQRAIVERVQVYTSAADYRTLGLAESLSDIDDNFRTPNRPLPILRDLSNRDKHRLLISSYLRAFDPIFDIQALRDCNPVFIGAYWSPVVLKDGMDLFLLSANATCPNPEVEVNLATPPTIAFEGAGGGAAESIDACATMTLRIVREFEQFF